MTRWPILLLTYLSLASCQMAGGPSAPLSDTDCPGPHPCDDPDADSRLLFGPIQRLPATVAEYRPLKPGCPTTLQVMAWLRPIAFHAARPDAAADTPSNDPSDFTCGPPEAPLLRAGRDREQKRLIQTDMARIARAN